MEFVGSSGASARVSCISNILPTSIFEVAFKKWDEAGVSKDTPPIYDKPVFDRAPLKCRIFFAVACPHRHTVIDRCAADGAHYNPRMTIHHRLQVRMLRDGVIALGPGKAALLDAIRSDGSISAAARRLSMSYRRAWLLVEEMNRCFSHALVETATGGNRGGGAHLTEAGVEVLSRYRAMEAAAQEAIASHLAGLRSLLADEEPSELNLADSG